MFFRFLSRTLLCALTSFAARAQVIRVCADPNNLPFSNRAGAGFENRIAVLLARDLQSELQYTWWAEQKSSLEKPLQARLCDVVLGVPSMLYSVLTTAPYYRSTYVFVSRTDRTLHISSLLDPRLNSLRIGIHIVGNDYAPPAHLLARRGLAGQLIGYKLSGPENEENPPSQLLLAVAQGAVDVAIVWGPIAGYFVKNQPIPLTIAPVSPAMFLAVPFTYDISAAVRKGDTTLLAHVQNFLQRACQSIATILSDYAIPLAAEGQRTCEYSQPVASSLP
jgi:mxaJ protein